MNKKYLCFVPVFISFFVGSAELAKADIFIQELMRNGGETVTRTIWIGKNCARVDAEKGKSTQTIIMSPDKNRYYFLNPGRQQYWWLDREGLCKNKGPLEDLKVTDVGMLKRIKNWFCHKYIIEASWDFRFPEIIEVWATEEIKVDQSMYSMAFFSYPRIPGSGLIEGPRVDEYLKELLKIKGVVILVQEGTGVNSWGSEVTDILQQPPPQGIYEIPSSYTDQIAAAAKEKATWTFDLTGDWQMTRPDKVVIYKITQERSNRVHIERKDRRGGYIATINGNIIEWSEGYAGGDVIWRGRIEGDNIVNGTARSKDGTFDIRWSAAKIK